MHKKDKDKIDEDVNRHFDYFMLTFLKWRQLEIDRLDHPDDFFVDAERIMPYLLYKTYKSQERLNKFTSILIVLTALLLVFTIVLIYYTIL